MYSTTISSSFHTFTSFVLGVIKCTMNRCTCRHTPWFCMYKPSLILNEDVEVKKEKRERKRERERGREGGGERDEIIANIKMRTTILTMY